MKLLERALDWALDRLLGAMSKSAAEPERAPGQLDSRDVAIQNRASHVPEAHKGRCLICARPISISPDACRGHDRDLTGNVTRLPAPPRVPKVPSSRYDK